MSTKTMSALILLGTLLLGGTLGMFVSGTVAQRRRDRLDRLRGPGGFVEQMERVISPRDATQRDALLPFLEATDVRNRAIIRQAEDDLQSVIRGMQQQVDSLLDDDQRERLREAVEQVRPLSPPPGGGPPAGGPPPGRPGSAEPPPGGPPPGGPRGG